MVDRSVPPSPRAPAHELDVHAARVTDGVLAAPIGDEVVLYDPRRGRAHRLNRSAAAVWEGLDAGLTGEALVAALADAFAVAPDTVAADVATMVEHLASEGLVIGADLPQPAPVPPPTPGSWLTLPPSSQPAGPGSADHPVPTVLALQTAVQLATSSEDMSAHLRDLLAPLRAGAHTVAQRRYELVAEAHGVELRADGRLLRTAPDWRSALPQVVIGLNHLAAHPDPPDVVTLHAAAVAIGGRAVVCAGVPGAGKSTLVTALVAAGGTYLSDEVVGLRDDGTVVAYPKPITLELDAPRRFDDLGAPPGAAADAELGDRRQRLVDPRRLGTTAAPGATAPLAAIVLPAYVPGAPGVATPCEPVDALLALLANTFNLAERGAPGLALLADVAVSVPVVRLELDDLDVAVAAVDAIVRGAASP